MWIKLNNIFYLKNTASAVSFGVFAAAFRDHPTFLHEMKMLRLLCTNSNSSNRKKFLQNRWKFDHQIYLLHSVYQLVRTWWCCTCWGGPAGTCPTSPPSSSSWRPSSGTRTCPTSAGGLPQVQEPAQPLLDPFLRYRNLPNLC